MDKHYQSVKLREKNHIRKRRASSAHGAFYRIFDYTFTLMIRPRKIRGPVFVLYDGIIAKWLIKDNGVKKAKRIDDEERC